MGRKGGRGRGGGGLEDQYGECFASQDRADRFQQGGRGGSSGFSGGGSAGGTRKGADVSYARHVPKFLQGHMHLLGRKEPGQEDAMTVEAPEEVQNHDLEASDEQAVRLSGTGVGTRGPVSWPPPGSGDFVGAMMWNMKKTRLVEALLRAVRENPALAEQYPELGKVLDKGRAAEEKERGNQAFAAQRYEEAVRHFSECIRLDPACEVYYSNRAAAYTSMKQYTEALADAKEAVRLSPSWARSWARLGAAYFGLKLYAEAKEAYEKAVNLEPKNESLQQSLQKASVQAHKQEEEGKHTFKSKDLRSKSVGTVGGVRKVRSDDRPASKQKKGLLSFDPDDDG